jgi:16S rRNA processing protein RimM
VAGGEPRLLEVGRVVRPHGLRGEVVVSLLSNRPERLATGSELVAGLRPPRRLEVVASRPHRGRHLVRFAGVERVEEAEELRGAPLLAEPLEDPDAWFAHELIGLEVIDTGGVLRGRVVALEANPASDLLVVDERYYVPLRFVVERRDGALVVGAPDGLFE